MNAGPQGSNLHTQDMVAVLPAEGATLATSLSRGHLLVAHTGNAHLGVSVDRAFLRGLARAQGTAEGGFHGYWARDQVTSSARPSPVATQDESSVAFVDLPAVIPLRRATSHTFAVSGSDIHLTLHATRDPERPDAHVELRLSPSLLAQLGRHQRHVIRNARIVAMVGFLLAVVLFVLLVTLLS